MTGYSKSPTPNPAYVPAPTDFEGDPDPESDNETFVYTEKRVSLSSFPSLSQRLS